MMNDGSLKYPFLDLKAANERYREALRDAAGRVIDSGRYIGGDEVKAFESDLAAICNAPFAVGVSNGLDALRMIFEGYKAIGKLKEGDEVIVAANTYIATILAITQTGLKPVIVDPDILSMNLSAEGIRSAIGPSTKAVVLVHLFGRVCWDEEMADIIRSNGLIAVEDVAQAIGGHAPADGLNGSRMTGALGHAGAFSFYPTKNIGALGDAGAVVTADAELADAVRALANYGSDRRYHNIYAGFNCRLDPIQAAMLRVKLPDMDAANSRRFARAVAYDRHITLPAITKPAIPTNPTGCVWHQYVVRIPQDSRDAFRRHLLENGIGTDIHYPVPPHLQHCYNGLHHNPLPITELLAAESVSLPIGDHLGESGIREIAGIINSFKF